MPLAVNEILQSCFLFKGLSGSYIEQLKTIGKLKSFNKKEAIFFEGEPAKGFYIVVSGKVKIFKLSSEGREQILHIFAQGEPFGEAAAFADMPYPANAAAMENSQAFYIPRTGFERLLKENPSLSLNLLAILSKRLMIFARMIGDLSLKEVPGRLATYLLISSAQKGGTNSLSLDLTKTQLASLLGTIPETLSRILSRMQKAGIIEVHGADITIKNRGELQKISGLTQDDVGLTIS